MTPLLLCFCFLSLIAVTHCVSQADVNTMKDELRAAMFQSLDARENLIPGSVRLAFHDCVGSCDGCLNLAHPDNAGLATTTNQLEVLYGGHSHVISRADFWTLAGITALDIAGELAARRNCGRRPQDCPTHSVVFKYGRDDCPTSPHTTLAKDFPQAHGDWDHVMEFFNDKFGFAPNEVVALLGAHTLGRARRQVSGFGTSPWVARPNHLDNAFFRDLINSDLEWTQTFRNLGTRQNPDFRFWWRHGNGGPPPPPGGRRKKRSGHHLHVRQSPPLGGEGPPPPPGGEGPPPPSGGEGPPPPPGGEGPPPPSGGEGPPPPPGGEGPPPPPGGEGPPPPPGGEGPPPPPGGGGPPPPDGRGLMLNSDMCLMKDIQLDNDGRSSCTYETCQASATAALIQSYAEDNALWLKDFSSVFQRMIDHGHTGLLDPS